MPSPWPAPALLTLLLVTAIGSSAHARGTGLVFVSNEQSDDIAVVDPKKNWEVVKRIATARRPRDLHFIDGHSKLLVACGDSDEIDVIDVAKLAVADRIPTGPSPEIFLPIADGTKAFVSDEENSAVEEIDLTTKKTLKQFATGPEPEGLAFDGQHLYATSEIADIVHEIDPVAGKVLANVVVGTRPRRLLLRTERHELWVTDELSGDISVIDTAKFGVRKMLTFDPPGFRRIDVTPVGLARSHDGKKIFITLGRADHVAVVDASTDKIISYILVGRRAWGVAVSRDDKTLYVTNGLSDDLSIIDLASAKALKTIPIGRTPHSVAIDD